MGVVYRMVDDATGENVAVKTVLVMQHRVMAALRNEMRTLQRIRHDGVVQVLSGGTANGQPWYAMELLGPISVQTFINDLWHGGETGEESGSTLTVAGRQRGYLQPSQSRFVGSGTVPRAAVAGGRLPATLSLYSRLAEVLAHIHRLGLVHRDLKPSNVFLRSDGAPVVADFGLASRALGTLGRSALTWGEERLLGTPSYASPEQILGQFVDARADLYSFGCMLFEALTGRPPFIQLGDASTLQQHLAAPPLPPSELVAGVPPDLDHLVLRLLAKEARHRAIPAEQVADELRTISGGSTSAPRTIRGPDLYRPSLAGRDRALAQLATCRAAARVGRGSLVLLLGESGIGKTFLACEAIRLAGLEQFYVVTSECLPAAAVDGGTPEVSGAPLHAFRSLLLAMTDRCVERGTDYTAWLFGDAMGLLSEYEPTLRELPGYSAEQTLEPLPTDAALQRLLNALSETLGRFVEEQPLLLAIDDLQWADELSLKLLRFLTENRFAGRPVLLIANVRSEESPDSLRELAAHPNSVTIELGRLDAATISRLASDMLSARSLPPHFVDFLVQQSEGNPFFVGEYLRAAAAEGLLVRDDGAWRVSDDFDVLINATSASSRLSSVHGLVGRRLGGLGDVPREALEAAAVLGREFAPELLSAVVRADDEVALRALEALRGRQILETAAGGALRFVHDRLRESAYAAILPVRRRELHRRAALVLETQYEGSAELWSQHAVLARHWAAGRVPRRALDHFVKAAHGARAAFALNDAIAYFHGAIREAHELLAADPLAARLLPDLYENLGELESRAGRQQLARDAFERADTRLPVEHTIARARLARRTGKTHELENCYDAALEALDRAEQRLGPAPDGVTPPSPWYTEWLDIQIQRAWACYWTAPVGEMSALIERTDAATVERFGSATQRAHFFQVVALLHMRTERFLLSEESLEWARRAFSASLDASPQERPGIHFTWAFALLFSGRLDEASPELQKVLAGAEASGDTAVQCRALSYLLVLERRRGRVVETRHLAQRTLELASASQMKHYIGAAQANLGWTSFRDGYVDSARSLCEGALNAWRSARPSAYPFEWLARWPLVAIALEAEDQLESARELLRTLLDASQQRMSPRLTACVEGALASPAGEETRRALRECLNVASAEGLI